MSIEDMPDHVLTAYRLYERQPWERSIRKLAKELNRSPSGLFHWSARYEWTKHVQQVDLEQRGAVFNRRKWRRAEAKIRRYGPDPRFWTRAGRHQMARSYHQRLRANRGEITGRAWHPDTAAYLRYVRAHPAAEVHVVRRPIYLGSA